MLILKLTYTAKFFLAKSLLTGSVLFHRSLCTLLVLASLCHAGQKEAILFCNGSLKACTVSKGRDIYNILFQNNMKSYTYLGIFSAHLNIPWAIFQSSKNYANVRYTLMGVQ
jgi:hypothetical protein